MEGLTRLVSESLVRHGLDRPVDYRRLRWSRWFRCESHHSLLLVPSKAGVFALAEEILTEEIPDLDSPKNDIGTAAFGCPPERSEASMEARGASTVEERGFSPASGAQPVTAALAAENRTRRMLAVTHFFQDDDIAFVLDRMLTKDNPLRRYLNSGRCFIRFVIIEDRFHRRQIHNSLAQWLSDSAQKASGIGSHFAASLELTPATEYVPPSTSVPREIGKAAASAGP